MSVSDPHKPDYGKHWSVSTFTGLDRHLCSHTCNSTKQRVTDAFAPHNRTVTAVRDWVSTALGKTKEITHTDNKLWLAFDATTEELDSLLYAQHHESHDEASGHAMIAFGRYQIPKDLQDHVDYITPGVKGVRISSGELRRRSSGSEGHDGHSETSGFQPQTLRPMPPSPKNYTGLDYCDELMTLACLRALYQFDMLNPNANVSAHNSMGIYQNGDFYAQ